ncbi:isochorismatase family cysteine hydrolase [Streptomyces sp. NPDC023723]|uniref:cysteine hydrolase family protein n=1 Tax=Streptomyces sp. NPDC023723 TaxID=3154323 RepID=UPI0033FC0DBB
MSKQALLVMDVQNLIVDRYADGDYLHRLQRAVDGARAGQLPVIYAAVGFRPGYPEVNPRNKMFGGLAGRAGSSADEEANRIHDAVRPREGDIIVTKRRVSAFSGSDLDLVLRSSGVDHLVLTGIATSGVVLSTVRQAADLDYELTVLSDACQDIDSEVHRVLMEKIFPQQAEVVTVAEWTKSFEARCQE